MVRNSCGLDLSIEMNRCELMGGGVSAFLIFLNFFIIKLLLTVESQRSHIQYSFPKKQCLAPREMFVRARRVFTVPPAGNYVCFFIMDDCLLARTVPLKGFKITANSTRALLISWAGCTLFYSLRRTVNFPPPLFSLLLHPCFSSRVPFFFQSPHLHLNN